MLFPFPFNPKPKIANPLEWTVRPFDKKKDQTEVINLICERFAELGMRPDLEGDDIDLTDIDRYWREPGGEFMVLLHGGQLVGSIAVQPLLKEPRVSRFSWYYLKKQVEGKGVGLYLLKWGLEWCINHNMMAIELWTGESRWWAHKMYKKFGFVHEGIKKKVRDNPPYHTLLFRLELTPQNVSRLRKAAEAFSIPLIA